MTFQKSFIGRAGGFNHWVYLAVRTPVKGKDQDQLRPLNVCLSVS